MLLLTDVRLSPRIVTFIEETIEHRLGLVLNREKMKIVKLRAVGDSIDFLGYTFRRERSLVGTGTYIRMEASTKALLRMLEALREATGPNWCFMPVSDVIAKVTKQVRGWLNYFRFGHPERAKRKIVPFTENLIVRHLRRRSQRPYRPPAGSNLYEHIRSLGLRF